MVYGFTLWTTKRSQSEDDKKRSDSWTSNIIPQGWTQNSDFPSAVIPTILLTSTILGSVYVYRRWVRRIPDISYIRPAWFGRRSMFGKATSVGDGDNFRFYHTPGGRLLGWGWLPGKSVPPRPKAGQTIAVRLAGIDAPECSHFGKPAQPYSSEALAWLKTTILNGRVRVKLHRRDQYDRVVATVWIRQGFLKYRKSNVGLEMVKAGLAGVYEAKTGTEWGGLEDKYRAAEVDARSRKKGMWASKKGYESPRAYKTRMAIAEDT